MEDSLRESLNRIHLNKEHIAKHQLMSLECSTQFQNEMNLPFMVGMQETQPMPWFSDHDPQQLILPNETSFLQQRDLKCSADASLLGYPGFYSNGKQIEMDAILPVDNVIQECTSFNDFTTTCMGVQIGEQYPYSPPYGNLNLPEDKKMIPDTNINFPGQIMDYQVHSNFELVRSLYDNRHQGIIPAPAPCSIPIFSHNLYPPKSYSQSSSNDGSSRNQGIIHDNRTRRTSYGFIFRITVAGFVGWITLSSPVQMIVDELMLEGTVIPTPAWISIRKKHD
ncbi:Agamous-like MADS-box protein AGL65-like protein [Drosera capensis]